MRPLEVKKLAQYLLDNKIGIAKTIKNIEVIERNIVGRFYYYVYLEVRESLKVNLLRKHRVLLEEAKGTSLHCILPETLKAISSSVRNQNQELSSKFKAAADSLRNLRKLRNYCDYDISLFINDDACRTAANEILDIIPIVAEVPNIDRNILGESIKKATKICQNLKHRI